MVSFDVTDEQDALIVQIAERASSTIFKDHPTHDRQSIEMDLCATIAQGCDLDLEKLLAFDGFNFAHDLGGIYRHLDRGTGLLKDHFLPRCAH